MHPVPTTIAAAALVGLGGAGGVALTAETDPVPHQRPPAGAPPVEVRTQVIHRTVRVIRHERPKHATATASPTVPAPAPAVVPVRAQPAVTPAPPAARTVVRPLRSRSSATGHGSGDDGGAEREGGGDE